MVRAAGLEPARAEALGVLSPMRLPIPPRPHFGCCRNICATSRESCASISLVERLGVNSRQERRLAQCVRELAANSDLRR